MDIILSGSEVATLAKYTSHQEKNKINCQFLKA